MKSILISDNFDTVTGLRLGGIQGVKLNDLSLAYETIEKYFNKEDIGIIIITKNVLLADEEKIMELKLKSKQTLIITIPDQKERFDNYLTKYIKESVGIKF